MSKVTCYLLSDLIGFDDALSLVIPPFLLQLLQLFAFEKMQNCHVDAAPAPDNVMSRQSNIATATIGTLERY